MAEIRDERDLVAEGFERVHVELDWYDGPRAGLADVGGVAHYFRCRDVDFSVDPDQYLVWPAASADVLALEREQWAILAEWNLRHEAGDTDVDSHPGHGGIDARYDELTVLLTPHRAVPERARRLVAEWRFTGGARYRLDGVDYWVRWGSAE